ncbi:glucose-1-phosphate adenylyltransferase subunit GlgD [Oscillospiraceae bacterium OttesenSCG-928-G22]|nr:glucose-1-phosphate adenylyltransferase subunit GlgD [Oscillospiraceae bacterium OttesenSCG-928-G22]
MREMHGILFAYHSGTKLREISSQRTVASIPFGGRYRVIDFMLSNMVNSGITDVGVIMEENYQSLLDHLGTGKDWDLSRKRGGLWLLPPFGWSQYSGEKAFRGKMEALWGVQRYVEHIRQEYVVLADCDVVLNIDLTDVLRHHREAGADITAVLSERVGGEAEGTTYLLLDRDGYALDVLLSPAEPKGRQSLGIYLLSKKLLLELIAHCQSRNLYGFEDNVLQKMRDTLKISGFVSPAFAVRMQSTPGYFQNSMMLLDPRVRTQLLPRDERRRVRTKVRDEAPTYYSPGSAVTNTLMADGCYIDGAIKNSIIFRGVTVEKGATVENCVLMQDTVVSAGASLRYVITDKNVVINAGRSIMGHSTYPVAIAKGAVV